MSRSLNICHSALLLPLYNYLIICKYTLLLRLLIIYVLLTTKHVCKCVTVLCNMN